MRKLPFQVENYILNVKREHTTWVARKIRERLVRRFSGIKIPAKSTIHALLDRHSFVERRGRARRRAQGTPLSLGQTPNELWRTDCKGEFLARESPVLLSAHGAQSLESLGHGFNELQEPRTRGFRNMGYSWPLLRKSIYYTGSIHSRVQTPNEKHWACRMLLREVFQCEFAADFQVKLSAASMD